MKTDDNRLKSILRASVVAIFINTALGIFKAIVGFLTHSVAITMDAINNFTDAASSFITIMAAYFASKDADRKHPFGYGRIEYLGTLLIGGLILYAGISAFIESMDKIINPNVAEYSVVTITIIIVAILVKILLALFTIKVGKNTNSDSLIASGKEAVSDIAISIATVVAAGIYVFANISIEAWLGVIISIMIIKAGVETLKEIVDKILGTPAEVSLVQDIKKEISAMENVIGAYDLILHNYGPDSYMASVHVAVCDTISVNEFDDLTRNIQDCIFEKYNVIISAVGMYSINTHDRGVIENREIINEIALSNEYVHAMHGFYMNSDNKKMRFDLVISFDAKNRRDVYNSVCQEIRDRYPDYEIVVGLDVDFNEAYHEK